jgi:gas vesicle protein
MRFILGAVAGFAAGVAASTLSSGKLGRELRDELDGIRADLEKRDYEAVGNRLEARFKDLQSNLEQRLAEAKEPSQGAADIEGDVAETLDTAAADVSEAVEDVVEEATPA